MIVAVDFAKFSTAPEAGRTYIGCAPTPTTGTATTGYTAFAMAGYTTAGDQHDGPAFICRIGVSEIPNSQEPTSAQDACINTPPTTALWNYWHANAGATTWTFSSSGAMSYQPQPGSIDAWAYGPEDTPPTLTPQQVRAESTTVPTTLTVMTSTLPGATAGVNYSPGHRGGRWRRSLHLRQGSGQLATTRPVLEFERHPVGHPEWCGDHDVHR